MNACEYVLCYSVNDPWDGTKRFHLPFGSVEELLHWYEYFKSDRNCDDFFVMIVRELPIEDFADWARERRMTCTEI